MVYLMISHCGRVCKIGYSVNPKSRLIPVQSKFKVSIYEVYAIAGHLREEKTLQGQFSDYSIGREWFYLVPDILYYFKRYGKRIFRKERRFKFTQGDRVYCRKNKKECVIEFISKDGTYYSSEKHRWDVIMNEANLTLMQATRLPSKIQEISKS